MDMTCHVQYAQVNYAKNIKRSPLFINWFVSQLSTWQICPAYPLQISRILMFRGCQGCIQIKNSKVHKSSKMVIKNF